MSDERKKINTETFTVHEAVNGLIDALKEAGYNDFSYDEHKVKYHIDVGLLVLIKSKGLPDFPVDTPWLIELSRFDWMLHDMEVVGAESGVYDVVFVLEVDI
jgi:hypothetical protein